MVARKYIPDAGDLIWIDFDPQSGHEQAGRRPGLVLSPSIYNHKAGLAIVCPVTSQLKGYPFEVPLPDESPIRGAVLADHIKSLDWKGRRAERAGAVPRHVLTQVRARLSVLLALEA